MTIPAAPGVTKAQSLTHERLLLRLSYDPETGVFVHIGRHRRLNMRAGCVGKDGYICIKVDKKSYQAHRLAWFYVHGSWPSDEIDHINRIRSDNRIVNLRSATTTQQNLNSSLPRANKSGYRGVHFSTNKRHPWKAQIWLNGKRVGLGYFSTAEAAHAVYAAVYKAKCGEFVGELVRAP